MSGTNDPLIDLLSTVETRIDNLLDGNASVELMDCMPRIVPRDRTTEIAITRSARVSTGNDPIQCIESDKALIRYLVLHDHTSPLEAVKFTFRLKVPIAPVARHILRHRTAAYNEESQRYKEVSGIFFHPSRFPDGIRIQLGKGASKQSSESIDVEDPRYEEIRKAYELAERDCERMKEHYHRLIELGASRETARFCLPQSVYTEFYMSIDLNNLLKFLRLRTAPETQLETRLIAQAMERLVRPLAPTVFQTFYEKQNQISLNEKEARTISNMIHGQFDPNDDDIKLQIERKYKISNLSTILSKTETTSFIQKIIRILGYK